MKKRFHVNRNIKIFGVIALIIAAFFLGRALNNPHSEHQQTATEHEHSDNAPTIWTCSMHPQIKLNNPGKCPLCFMDLIALTQSMNNDDTDTIPRLVLSKRAQALAGIMTVPVVRREMSSDISMSGKIAFDETRLEIIASRVSGRIDKLYANLTGIQVKKGDHLAMIYSPELLSNQQELISASAAMKFLPESASELVRSNAQSLFSAAEERMRLLGFSQQEIRKIVDNQTISDNMTIRASQEGIIIDKGVNEGDYISVGSPLFRIADLRSVWVLLDAYESDLSWLRLGQAVDFTVEAFPGETFHGTISLIDPVVNSQTRTIKVRVIASNKDLRLKPDMFVKAKARAPVTQSGRLKKNSLRGKWISPMHPQIVKDGPGTCDICGMPLVPAESLGYATSGFENSNPLIIPATAPLLTGERAVVYVETNNDNTGATYEGREVILGPSVQGYYIVKSGLSEGEKVVVNGAFRIDSELQIHAKKSMMTSGSADISGTKSQENNNSPQISKEDNLTPSISDNPLPPDFSKSLSAILDVYFQFVDALTKDDMKSAKKALTEFETVRKTIKAGSNSLYRDWNRISDKITEIMKNNKHIETLDEARSLLDLLSAQMILLQKQYGNKINGTRYIAYCPMAFNNKGAYWLQREKEILNPYFGPVMLKCGEIRQ